MISFDKIDKHNWLYDFYMNYLSIVHNHIYYRHFYVLNEENIPKKGEPTLVIANHQNGLMDALAILHTMFRDRRQPVFIARGDIFKKDGVARVLRFLKIMPTFRTRDGNIKDVRSNIGIYNRVAKVLNNGGTVVIFPEATHQHGHYMNTFKKGFCRIAFTAEEINDYNLGLKILPLNIHYSNYFTFRSDLMVTIGKPFTIEDFFDTYKENHDRGYLALIEKARARVKELTPDIDIPEYYNEIEALTHMMSEPLLRSKGLKPNNLPNQKDAAMTIIANIKQFKEKDEAGFTDLMLKMRRYLSLLKQTTLHNWVINKKLNVPAVALRILIMFLTLPLFIFGFINNYVPRAITQFFTNKAKDPMFHSSFQYVVGTIAAFPLCYMLIMAVVWIASKSFLFAAVYMMLTFLCAFVVHYYKIGVHKLFTVFRARKIRRTEHYQELCTLNNEITKSMEEIIL